MLLYPGIDRLLKTFNFTDSFFADLLSQSLGNGLNARLAEALVGSPQVLSADFVANISSSLALEYSVVDAMTAPFGKWSLNLGSVVLIDSRFLLRAIKTAADRVPLIQLANSLAYLNQTNGTDVQGALVSSAHTPLTDELLKLDVSAFAFLVVVQFNGRFEAYQQSGDALTRSMADYSNSVMLSLGLNVSNPSLALTL